VPVYGMKEHASIDVRSGLALTTVLFRASEHDTNYFQYVVIKSMHTRKMPPVVYSDKDYHGRTNREFLHIDMKRRDHEEGCEEREAHGFGDRAQQNDLEGALLDRAVLWGDGVAPGCVQDPVHEKWLRKIGQVDKWILLKRG